MNTRNAHSLRLARGSAGSAQRQRSRTMGTTGAAARPLGMEFNDAQGITAPEHAAAAPAAARLPTTGAQARGPEHTHLAGRSQSPSAVRPVPALGTGVRHSLTDLATNARLAYCEQSVTARFDVILPTLKSIAALPRDDDFVSRAQALAERELGHRLPESWLEQAWLSGLEMRSLYCHCVFNALGQAVAVFAEDLKNQVESIQDTQNFFLDCGFHAVAISPCSDGRLKGLLRYILRLPLTSFARRSAYAGALFDVEADVKHWVATELRRYREGVPTTADAGSRYLKVAVYHFSSSDPAHQGCAKHGSNDLHAIEAALERLDEFREAIENAFCCGASTDLLLIGVDTDNDAIRVHIPDAAGNLSAHRYVDNARLYADTAGQNVDQACLRIYEAIRNAGKDTPWGQGVGEPHDGMRRLIANLLINNLSQIDYVQVEHGGRYADIGHAERYISVGDGFEEVQVRNIAYYAHLHTLEEGVADMDIGIQVFTHTHVSRGLPIPVAIHYRYDGRVPGARSRAVAKAQRVGTAVMARYRDLAAQRLLFCQLSVQDLPAGSPLEVLEGLHP